MHTCTMNTLKNLSRTNLLKLFQLVDENVLILISLLLFQMGEITSSYVTPYCNFRTSLGMYGNRSLCGMGSGDSFQMGLLSILSYTYIGMVYVWLDTIIHCAGMSENVHYLSFWLTNLVRIVPHHHINRFANTKHIFLFSFLF